MKITLAYPRDGHDADATIEVPDAEGRSLIHDGLARLAPAKAPKSARSSDPSPTPGDDTKEAGA